MHPAFVFILVSSLGGIAAFLTLLRSLSKSNSAIPAALQAGRFSAQRYAPLASLLNTAEYDFLRTQPGFTPEVGRRFRAERRAICRQYLNLLRSDFAALYAESNRILLYSKQDRSDLAAVLAKQRLLFAIGLIRVETLLVLHRFYADDVRFDDVLKPVTELHAALESAILSGATA